jgi:signal transduction histidine kinase
VSKFQRPVTESEIELARIERELVWDGERIFPEGTERSVMHILEMLSKQSKPLLAFLGFILVVLIGVLDYLTGPAFSSLIFYLVPIILVTWFVGRSMGLLISVVSAFAWVLADITSRPFDPHTFVPIWNIAEKLGIFLIVVYILLKLEEEKEISKKQEQERKNMLSMFAHDMKNPAIVAEGFLSRLRSGKAGPVTEKQISYIELIRNELNKLEGFITGFLEFSRLESKEYKPVPLPFALSTAMKNRIEAARSEADKKDIKIIFDASDGMETMVNADAAQIDRVITNLLDNAVKYTGNGGTITVNLVKRYNDVLIQVTDTGTGIPENHLPYIFDAFYRVTRDSRGSGLGLSIVKSIVEANRGKIWVESVLGKGSTFSFTLPMNPSD